MKILTLASKVWWLAKSDELRAKKGLVVMDAVKLIMEKFKFAAAPPGLPGPGEGYVFRQGGVYLPGGAVGVPEFTVFTDGISLEIQSSTDDLLLALDEFLAVMWEMGLSKPITPPTVVLQSMITFDAEADLQRLLPAFDPIAKALAAVTGAQAPHQFKTIEYVVDPKIVPPLGSKVFRLERRDNEPFSLNRWFSFCNSTTADHTGILERIEKGAKTAAN